MPVPFQALSDGYKAFIGWVGDLLFHVCYGCPSGKKLVESSGLVLVDEIDLHLHPKWQMQVIRTVARALPRMQFVFTSHSPLVAGSLEWMNIIKLTVGTKSNRTIAKRLQESIHGLDADQILLTDFFGLKSTRADKQGASNSRGCDTKRLWGTTRRNVPTFGRRHPGWSRPRTAKSDDVEEDAVVIRHDITPAEFRKRIRQTDPSWYARAAEILRSLPQKPKSKDFKSLWRDIVQVYMDLARFQVHLLRDDCSKDNISNDIEHFRPKSHVAVWKPPRKFVAAGAELTLQPAGRATRATATWRIIPGTMRRAARSATACSRRTTSRFREHANRQPRIRAR